MASQDTQPAQEIEKTIRPLVVLAVDDDALVLLNTLAMLEELGHTALGAYSASEALNLVRSDNSIDLVITDQAMPHMTGAQLADAIKQERPNLPIILATGYAELPPGVGTTLQRLSKPFTLKDLAGAIAKQNLKGKEAGRIVKFRATNRPTK